MEKRRRRAVWRLELGPQQEVFGTRRESECMGSCSNGATASTRTHARDHYLQYYTDGTVGAAGDPREASELARAMLLGCGLVGE
jgi:hypothetical protein